MPLWALLIWNMEFHIDKKYFAMEYATSAVYTTLPAYEVVFVPKNTGRIDIRTIHQGDHLWAETIDFIRREKWGVSLADRMKSNAWQDWECVVIALKDHKIAGFCDVVKNDNIPDSKYSPFIGYVYVKESERGNRISERMIHKAESVILQNGFHDAYIVTGWKGLYEKFGYSQIDEGFDNKRRKVKIYHRKIQ